jgi:hypothetical protein
VNLAPLYAVLKGVAALSGLVAFIGFAYTYSNDVALKQSSVNQSWLDTEIYQVVADAGVAGLTREEIVARVQKSYFATGASAGVATDVGRDRAILRGIVELTAKSSLTLDTTGHYIVPTVPKNYLTQDLQFSRMEGFNEMASRLVSEHPGQYTGQELRRQLESQGATPREAWQVVGGSLFLQPPAFVPADDMPYTTASKLKVLE